MIARLERRKARALAALEKAGASEDEVELAVEALEADLARDLAHLEYQSVERGTNLLIRERQREALAGGGLLGDDGGDRAAMEAEHNRRRAEAKERMLTRRKRRRAHLKSQGHEADDDEAVVAAIAELDAEEAQELAELDEAARRGVGGGGDGGGGGGGDAGDGGGGVHREYHAECRAKAGEKMRGAMDAEHNRRKAKVKERMLKRRKRRKAHLKGQGHDADDDKVVMSAMTELDAEEARLMGDVAAQIEREELFFLGQLDSQLAAKEGRDAMFHEKLAALNSEHTKATNAIREEWQNEYAAAKSQLEARLAERRAKRAQELLVQGADSGQIELELQQLNQDDLDQARALQQQYHGVLTMKLAAVHASHDNSVRALVAEDSAMRAVEETDADQLRRLFKKSMGERQNLEKRISKEKEEKRKALQKRLKERRKKLAREREQLGGGAKGGVELRSGLAKLAEAEAGLVREEAEALDAIEREAEASEKDESRTASELAQNTFKMAREASGEAAAELRVELDRIRTEVSGKRVYCSEWT